MTIERLDNSKDYEPGNVIVISSEIQNMTRGAVDIRSLLDVGELSKSEEEFIKEQLCGI